MPTKAELLEEVGRLTRKLESSDIVIHLKLDPIEFVQSSRDFQQGLENMLISKMCRACEANQVHVKHNDGQMEFTCPTCDYDWEENARYNEEGND